MLKIAILIFSLFLICCKPPTPAKLTMSFKDSLVKEHLASIDNLEFYDTIDYDYKILKAYFNNDSAFFNEMAEDLKAWNEESNKYPKLQSDSCVHLKKLSELNVDEAYRFRHRESFCHFRQVVTISRKDDIINLHYIEYATGFNDEYIEIKKSKGDVIKTNCLLVKDSIKILSVDDWYKLESALKKADYWGLKEHNPQLSFDGSTWLVEAFTKEPRYATNQQMHFVVRGNPQNSFAELGRAFMKFAGEKGMCDGIH